MTAFVVLALVLAITAAFTQVVFSSEKVTGWVEEALSKKDFAEQGVKVEFTKAQTTVLASFTHPFGIRIKGLKIQFTKDCQLFKGELETLTVPFHLMKALEKEIDLGLIRLNGGEFTVSKSCSGAVGPNGIQIGERVEAASREKKLEAKVLDALKRLAGIDLGFLKDSEDKLKYQGALLYDLKFIFENKNEFVIDRLKTLFGKGELEADGEWRSRLKTGDEDSAISGQFKFLKDSLDIDLNFEEKEAKLKAELKIKRRDVGDGLGTLDLEVKDFPLSIFSRFKEYKIMDLNLRKSWLDLKVFFDLDEQSISGKASVFKVHGEFGEMELGLKGVAASWNDSSWKQAEEAEFKLKDVDVEQLVGLTPKKKVQGVFGDFGKFNADLKFNNLNAITGDFESKDFSILFRSMGKSFSQKGEYARGTVEYIIDKKLVVMLNEVGITDGDFEGFVRLDYAYSDKQIRTEFEIPHFRLSPEIYKELFKIKVGGDLQISGKGRVFRKSLLKDKHKSADGEINFELKSEGASFKYWDVKKIESKCSLINKILGCKLNMDSLTLSNILAQKAGLEQKTFEHLVSEDLELKDKVLNLSLTSDSNNFSISWSSEVGVKFLRLGEKEEEILIRGLD